MPRILPAHPVCRHTAYLRRAAGFGHRDAGFGIRDTERNRSRSLSRSSFSTRRPSRPGSRAVRRSERRNRLGALHHEPGAHRGDGEHDQRLDQFLATEPGVVGIGVAAADAIRAVEKTDKAGRANGRPAMATILHHAHANGGAAENSTEGAHREFTVLANRGPAQGETGAWGRIRAILAKSRADRAFCPPGNGND